LLNGLIFIPLPAMKQMRHTALARLIYRRAGKIRGTRTALDVSCAKHQRRLVTMLVFPGGLIVSHQVV
jgi:hypothetical protein